LHSSDLPIPFISEHGNILNVIDEDTIFEKLGGESHGIKAIEQIVDRFYHFMDTLPEAKNIREQHPADLTESKNKLVMFLVGWSGGPQLYIEKFGHPRLRARHMPFKIGERERDQWLYCMFKALDDCQIPEPLNSDLKKSFAHIADFMRNQAPT
jgi:hemoglobin